jgi:hypothetical protein
MAEESDKTKGADFVEVVEKFFLDLIGTLIPGCALMLLLRYFFANEQQPEFKITKYLPDIPPWVAQIGFAYVLGHGMVSIGEFVFVRSFDGFLCAARKWKLIEKIFGKNLLPAETLNNTIREDIFFKAFVETSHRRVAALPEKKDDSVRVSEWRNLAISFAPNQRQNVFRFTFLSLLNLGVFTALVLSAIGILLVWVDRNALLSKSLLPANIPVHSLWTVPILVIAAFPFLERRYYFYRISIEAPFGMALAEMSQEKVEDKCSKTHLTIKLEN